jgi:hypothetical protein
LSLLIPSGKGKLIKTPLLIPSEKGKLIKTLRMKFLANIVTAATLVSLPLFCKANDDNVMPENSIQFQHFVALNDNQTCIGDAHARPFNNQIRGVNLGGWMVLEPWLT